MMSPRTAQLQVARRARKAGAGRAPAPAGVPAARPLAAVSARCGCCCTRSSTTRCDDLTTLPLRARGGDPRAGAREAARPVADRRRDLRGVEVQRRDLVGRRARADAADAGRPPTSSPTDRAARAFTTEDLSTPEINIAYGSWYLRYLLDRYDGDELLALAAYNGGMGNVDRWVAEARARGERLDVADIPFPETRAYVERVLDARRDYRRRTRASWACGRPSAGERHRVACAELRAVGRLVDRARLGAEHEHADAVGAREDLAVRAGGDAHDVVGSSGKRSPAISISPPPRSARKTSSCPSLAWSCVG